MRRPLRRLGGRADFPVALRRGIPRPFRNGHVDNGRIGRKKPEQRQHGFAKEDGVGADGLHGLGESRRLPVKGERTHETVQAAADMLQPPPVREDGEGMGRNSQRTRGFNGHKAVVVDGFRIDGFVGSHGETVSFMRLFRQEMFCRCCL